MVIAMMRSTNIPRLENGDRLTRAEFERRWEALPEERRTKAELVEGIVYMAAATRITHGRPHSLLAGWLETYAASTPGTDSLVETSIRLDEDNEPQPDAMLRLLPEAGGTSSVT